MFKTPQASITTITDFCSTGLIGAGVCIGIVFGALILVGGGAINPFLKEQVFSYIFFYLLLASTKSMLYVYCFFLLNSTKQ